MEKPKRSLDYVSDTTLLIDLWRELKKPGSATHFAQKNSGAVIGLPWVAKGEFLRGVRYMGHQIREVAEFLSSFRTLWASDTTLSIYAEIYSVLKHRGKLIGPHDLWIAASALEAKCPLLTRNTSEFLRVPDLKVVDYYKAPI